MTARSEPGDDNVRPDPNDLPAALAWLSEAIASLGDAYTVIALNETLDLLTEELRTAPLRNDAAVSEGAVRRIDGIALLLGLGPEWHDTVREWFLDVAGDLSLSPRRPSPPDDCPPPVVGLSAEDLFGWGWMGLMAALRRYDPATGCTFSSYAATRITGTMRDGVRSDSPVPKRLITLANKAHAATLVEESLADRTSPVWDLVDADRVRAAVEGFDDLPMGPRQRLYGLAGAARWLAG